MIEVKELCSHSGTLCGVSLDISEKGIYGILSADRNQKTELAEILCACKSKKSGELLLDGEALERGSIDLKRKIRLVPSRLCLEGSMSAVEYLNFVGNTLKLDTEKKYRQISEAMELVCIDGVQNRLFKNLSASERCRLSIAASLLGNPSVIVLDEPFAGLSRESLEEIYDILSMLSKIKTLILTSHKPDEVKRLCENIFIMSGGKIVLAGKVSDIEAKINATHELHITVRGVEEAVLQTLKSLGNVIDVKVIKRDANDVNLISVEHYPDSMIKDKIFAALSSINAPMLSVKERRLSLSDVYYSFTYSDGEKQNDTKGRDGK